MTFGTHSRTLKIAQVKTKLIQKIACLNRQDDFKVCSDHVKGQTFMAGLQAFFLDKGIQLWKFLLFLMVLIIFHKVFFKQSAMRNEVMTKLLSCYHLAEIVN